MGHGCQQCLGGRPSHTILWRHTHPLLATIIGHGSGNLRRMPTGNACGSGCNEYGHGVLVTLTAAPYPGSSFAGWSGACSDGGQCRLTIDAAKTVTTTLNGHSDLRYLPAIAR